MPIKLDCLGEMPEKKTVKMWVWALIEIDPTAENPIAVVKSWARHAKGDGVKKGKKKIVDDFTSSEEEIEELEEEAY